MKTKQEKSSNCISILFMCLANRILKLGNQHDLDMEDLYPVDNKDEGKGLIDELNNIWENEVRKARKSGKKPQLWKAVLKTFSPQLVVSVTILRFLDSFGNNMQVVMLCLYLEFLQGPHALSQYAAVWIAGISLGTLIKLFAYHHSDLQSLNKGMRLKIALTGMVYKKVLACTRSDLSSVTGGFIINLVSNDANRIEKSVMYATNFLRIFWDTCCSVTVLCVFVGWQGLTGFLVFGMTAFLTISMSRFVSRFREEQCVLTDQRLSAMNEIISGIRALKVNAWEWSYRDRVKDLRRREMKKVRSRLLVKSNLIAYAYVSTSLATLISVVALTYSGVRLSAAHMFTLAASLNIANTSIGIGLHDALYYVFDAMIALERMQNFLLRPKHTAATSSEDKLSTEGATKMGKQSHEGCDSVNETKVTMAPKTDSDGYKQPPKQQGYIMVKEMWSSWQADSWTFTLRGVNLSASSNQLVIVTGPVGSGKSSLLMSILGEIPIKQGSVDVRGTIAYASQTPWIFSDTVRENILFGKPFVEKKFKNVLKVCGLEEDMRQLPKGDMSMIGQRGVSLSGGQRSRVSLARAVYSDADILLLDDPLSAVDPKVGQHIFDECILGELSHRLRILATHQLQHLHCADHIVVLKKGRIASQGTFEELNDSAVLDELMREIELSRTETSSATLHEHGHESLDEADRPDSAAAECRDVEEEIEDRGTGTVTWRLYWQYLNAGLPVPLLCLMIGFFVAVQASLLAPYWWLSRMSLMSITDQTSGLNLGIFVAIIGGAFILSITRTSLFCYTLFRSSINLNDQMTAAVIKSPVLFFDTNSVGRIMNRFSKDTGAMDDQLPLLMYTSSSTLLQLVGVYCLTAVVNPWFILVIVPLMVGFVGLVKYYLKTARNLQRLEGLACSPLFAHISDTIVGIETIHAYKTEGDFMSSHIRNQNLQTRAYSLVVASNRWMGLHVDLLCAGFLTLVAVGTNLLKLDSALSGMLLMFAVGIVGQAQYGMRLSTEMECLMTSVERVIAYTRLVPEPGYCRETLPPREWPDQGAVTIRDLSLQYLEGGTRVLEGVNLDVRSKENVGIVGRTGAGKSSLVAALFRMPEPQGQVLIDGVDLGTINIQAARRAMAVISQEPVIFAGSLRRNLDPFQNFEDQEIWTALEDVQMKECVRNLPLQLLYHLGEAGSGFSVGERQLLCLARALLQRCKLLVLDEATANVDFRTDRLVQQVIREKFVSCTVLTIAHRVNTIMDYDKVVVMDRGHVVEYDEPKVLAGKTDGVFARLVNAYDKNGTEPNRQKMNK